MLRIAGSKDRTPRSHSTMSRLPRWAMYSAAISHSSYVAVSPRLSSTGLPTVADRLQQREVLHVAGADLQHVGVLGDHVDVGHVDAPRSPPAARSRARTSARMRSPATPSPWNAYGEVRGLYAPPRSSVAPARRACSAAASVCSADSTAHGPAISVNVSGPTGTPPTEIVLVRTWFSRLTSLYGAVIRTTSADARQQADVDGLQHVVVADHADDGAGSPRG